MILFSNNETKKYEKILEKIPWTSSQEGLRTKEFDFLTFKIKAMEFSYGFKEVDWCKKPHEGLVTSGTLHIDFKNEIRILDQGDAIAIPRDAPHKVIVSGDIKTCVLLIEKEVARNS